MKLTDKPKVTPSIVKDLTMYQKCQHHGVARGEERRPPVEEHTNAIVENPITFYLIVEIFKSGLRCLALLSIVLHTSIVAKNAFKVTYERQ